MRRCALQLITSRALCRAASANGVGGAHVSPEVTAYIPGLRLIAWAFLACVAAAAASQPDQLHT